MPRKNSSVIIDTNLWISYLISQRYIQLDRLILDHKLTLIFSQELLEEFFSVLSRPKFSKIFSEDLIQKILDLINDHSVLVEVNSKISVCRDPKDNFLLALSKDSKANYLLTGDDDLLEIGSFGITKILSYKDFLSLNKVL